MPEKLICNFCCGRVSHKSSLEMNKFKAREKDEGGSIQEVIRLPNTALKNRWDAFCQGRVTGPRKMSYSGLTSYQQSFTQVGLLDIISVCNQESFMHLGFCTSHSNYNWSHHPRRYPTLHPSTEATVLTEGELTAGDVLETTCL